ncbi:hypothetical protein EDB85DRAFT_1071674 [Lactarius pseudohatsudake]|nr:hypothetical protein EDB85DRAFT_1071674 [Lactarius pseudohatsudake]
MHKIETVRGYHYGTKKARLYRDIAVERRTWRDRLEDVLLLCVLFNSHRMYKDRLESTRPKGYVYLPDFRELIRSLLVEWSDSNLLATVFVSTNVAFLALPNINALAQTALLISTLFSMLSIVMGVHHVWRHSRRVDADDEDASRYLRLPPRTPRQPDATRVPPRAPARGAPLGDPLLHRRHRRVLLRRQRKRAHAHAPRHSVRRAPRAHGPSLLRRVARTAEERAGGGPCARRRRGEGRELVREAGLKNKVRRMKIARAQVMDGNRVRG